MNTQCRSQVLALLILICLFYSDHSRGGSRIELFCQKILLTTPTAFQKNTQRVVSLAHVGLDQSLEHTVLYWGITQREMDHLLVVGEVPARQTFNLTSPRKNTKAGQQYLLDLLGPPPWIDREESADRLIIAAFFNAQMATIFEILKQRFLNWSPEIKFQESSIQDLAYQVARRIPHNAPDKIFNLNDSEVQSVLADWAQDEKDLTLKPERRFLKNKNYFMQSKFSDLKSWMSGFPTSPGYVLAIDSRVVGLLGAFDINADTLNRPIPLDWIVGIAANGQRETEFLKRAQKLHPRFLR